jgi:hypothetical protein
MAVLFLRKFPVWRAVQPQSAIVACSKKINSTDLDPLTLQDIFANVQPLCLEEFLAEIP